MTTSFMQRVKKIQEKARADLGFRKELLTAPKKALSKAGFKFSDSFKLHVFENTKNCMHLVVPTHKVVIPQEYRHEKPSKNSSYVELYYWMLFQIQENHPFKDAIVKDPIQAIKDQGTEIPENFEIKIHFDKESEKHFVLERETMDDEALSENELALAAGGKGAASFAGAKTGEEPITNAQSGWKDWGNGVETYHGSDGDEDMDFF